MYIELYVNRGFISPYQTETWTGLPFQAIRQLESEGRFPASIEFAPGFRVWDCMEVIAWLENMEPGRDWRVEQASNPAATSGAPLFMANADYGRIKRVAVARFGSKGDS